MKCPFCLAGIDIERHGSEIKCECGAWVDYAGEWHKGDENLSGPRLAKGQSLEEFCDLYQRCNW